LYTGLRLDYRLRLWAPTSALCSVSLVAVFLVSRCSSYCRLCDSYTTLTRQQSDIIGYIIFWMNCSTFLHTRRPTTNPALLLLRSKFWFNCTQCVTLHIMRTALNCHWRHLPCPRLPPITYLSLQSGDQRTLICCHVTVVGTLTPHFRTSAFSSHLP